MTTLLFAARGGAIDTAKVLLDAGVAVDQAKMRCRSSNAIGTEGHRRHVSAGPYADSDTAAVITSDPGRKRLVRG